ncbi:hypothetical protein TSUD_282760 [Trifolium subterraneum]|uniref:Uncharacterized protein n=1 Tax=Trifolium subterraneum TaxID=3900 RepID=A0A2Z6PH65_TRISU|nr:hypothetical protein TSUD_282760 [Trifolium subterraneum]
MINNIDEVCDELLAMYQDCLRRDFTSIQLLKEANDRRPMWKQLNNQQQPPGLDKIKKLNRIVFDRCQDRDANSSEMEDSRMLQGDLMMVFKEGVSLLMNNLWARRFSISLCGSNPTPMLQYLADVIFFWFTQTIKPLFFDHIVRILKNEMYRLPYKTIHYDITEEVAKKLMVMYEECLQGNFSSVDILREESLSLASSFEETKGE